MSPATSRRCSSEDQSVSGGVVHEHYLQRGPERVESLLSEKGLRLLLVTEDEKFAQTLYKYLTPLGYNMDMASSGTAGWKRASSNSYDALLIDIALSGMDGLTLCRRLRDEVGLETPILMFMDGESLEAKVLGLNWGADVFINKSADMREFEAVVRALVRRMGARQGSHTLSWAGLELDPHMHTVTCEGVPLTLRPTAFTILARLMRQAPGVVTRKDLEYEIYGDFPPDSDSLRTHIHSLRRALQAAGRPILKTVTHVGFRLTPWPPAEASALGSQQ